MKKSLVFGSHTSFDYKYDFNKMFQQKGTPCSHAYKSRVMQACSISRQMQKDQYLEKWKKQKNLQENGVFTIMK